MIGTGSTNESPPLGLALSTTSQLLSAGLTLAGVPGLNRRGGYAGLELWLLTPSTNTDSAPEPTACLGDAHAHHAHAHRESLAHVN